MKELSKEQKKKFADYFQSIFLKDLRFQSRNIPEYQEIWKACLEANGLDSLGVICVDLKNLDWPEWARAVRFSFVDQTRDDVPMTRYETIRTLLRPATAWEPKYGAWHWVWKWGSSEKFASDDPSYLDIKSTRIAPVRDFEHEKDKPWEFFVSRGEYREAQKV
jgi:hypothetical protein